MGAGSGLRELFATGGVTFASSPLYRELCSVVADDEFLLELAAGCRPGQRPVNMLFAAVHLLVRREPEAALAQWYLSVAGPDAVRDPADVGPVFVEFCHVHSEQITEILQTRLVQTNVVKRAAALRFGLARIAERVAGPVALLEVGCSAGVLLGQDRYRYRVGEREWGRPGSPVVVDFDWRSNARLPDLNVVPEITARVGIDLYAIDPAIPADWAWMQALVWPENRQEAHLLDTALHIAAAHPPRRLTGDAQELIGVAISELPADLPVVIFHAATRAHIPPGDRPGFDAAIDAVGDSQDLFHLSLEGSSAEWFRKHRGSFLLHLQVAGPGRRTERHDLAIVDQHGEWITPVNGTT